MKEYRCPNCGAAVNPTTGKCDFCGSHFKIEEDNLIKIVSDRNIPIRTYDISVNISDWDLAELGEEAVEEQIVKKLSRAILDNMEWYDSYDVMSMKHNIAVRVKMIKPDRTEPFLIKPIRRSRIERW